MPADYQPLCRHDTSIYDDLTFSRRCETPETPSVRCLSIVLTMVTRPSSLVVKLPMPWRALRFWEWKPSYALGKESSRRRRSGGTEEMEETAETEEMKKDAWADRWAGPGVWRWQRGRSGAHQAQVTTQ